jgi:hypothetical protein
MDRSANSKDFNYDIDSLIVAAPGIPVQYVYVSDMTGLEFEAEMNGMYIYGIDTPGYWTLMLDNFGSYGAIAHIYYNVNRWEFVYLGMGEPWIVGFTNQAADDTAPPTNGWDQVDVGFPMTMFHDGEEPPVEISIWGITTPAAAMGIYTLGYAGKLLYWENTTGYRLWFVNDFSDPKWVIAETVYYQVGGLLSNAEEFSTTAWLEPNSVNPPIIGWGEGVGVGAPELAYPPVPRPIISPPVTVTVSGVTSPAAQNGVYTLQDESPYTHYIKDGDPSHEIDLIFDQSTDFWRMTSDNYPTFEHFTTLGGDIPHTGWYDYDEYSYSGINVVVSYYDG